ncbi:MAG: pseudouridine synthase [Candidatus Saccharimonadales bacterium]
MTPQTPDSLRLNKHLALTLGISRREADNLIALGKVTINDQIATLGARFVSGDTIVANGKKLADKTEYQYIALNKPTGYVCSRRQQGDNPTIYELLPNVYHQLKTVGRLDRDSSGIILLSNDGDFTFQMTHPSFIKVKIYNARLNKDLEPLHQQMISDYGVNLEDGPSKLQLERMGEDNRRDWIVTMHEGRNRQIRRTFESLGYNVIKLHRTNFGNYSVTGMKPGEYRVVDGK